MYSPSRKDFISVTLSDPHSHAYNNGKHRRQSCWRKWKQLSRLQRSLIFCLMALLLVVGLLSYPSLSHHWTGTEWKRETADSGPSDTIWLDMSHRALDPPPPPGVRPVPGLQEPGPPLQPHPAPEPHPGPAEGPGAIAAPRGPNLPFLSQLPLKEKTPKKGPLSLQKELNSSDTAGGEKHEEVEEAQEDNTDKKIVSWRGAMIEAEQGTDLLPSANQREGPPPADVPTNTNALPVPSSAEQQEAVREAFRHAWRGYREHAWGHDELKPVSKSHAEWFGLGLTLIDALDTMWILGLTEEQRMHRAPQTTRGPEARGLVSEVTPEKPHDLLPGHCARSALTTARTASYFTSTTERLPPEFKAIETTFYILCKRKVIWVCQALVRDTLEIVNYPVISCEMPPAAESSLDTVPPRLRPRPSAALPGLLPCA
ncbi:endoplasmic reticulum mannosyl-oligosaccharide 1,2-alpha-mannosidase [Eucyclogobius newberryi]|uniref:endoplasmic reticulum mannosyl-oligosaccharide 1,2-alpha-mannosidase n=1 Tax=Eucyclogobius newberryi TaxID=166745 RepID=UPI003B5C10D0